MNEQQAIAQSITQLQTQNWILMASVLIVGGALFFMIRVAWAELRETNKENQTRLGEHDVALGVLMERHETSKAIVLAGDGISDAIKHNSDRLINTLQAITPPGQHQRR